MNVITQAMADIRRLKIPPQILEIAFKNPVNTLQNTAPTSLTERIMEKVIRPVVLKDLKNISGKHIILPLTDRDIIHRTQGLNGGQIVTYYIKPALIENREIVSALSVSYTPYMLAASRDMAAAANSFYNNYTDLSSTNLRLMDSATQVPIVSTAMVELVGTHTVVVRNTIHESRLYDLRCVVSGDDDVNNFIARTSKDVRLLCEYAIKAYIYNNMLVDLDMGFLNGGREMPAIKNVVEGWSDMHEMYETYLRETMARVAFQVDQTRMNRFIAIQMNPSI